MNHRIRKAGASGSVARAGFTLIEMVAAASIGIIMAGTMVGIFSDALSFKRSTQAQDQVGQVQAALEKYFADVGQFPPALVNLYSDYRTGWNGPYLTGDPRSMLLDPWRQPLRYGTASAQTSGIPVAYVGSMGRNRLLDSDLTTFMNGNWNPLGDDLFQKVSSAQALSPLQQMAYRQLQTIRGLVYANNPHAAPNNWNLTGKVDPWGSQIVYIRCTGNSGAIYSFGPNRTDNNNNGVDICNTNLSARPDDLFVAAGWGQQTTIPWEGGEYAEPTECRSYSVIVENRYSDRSLLIYYQDEFGAYHSGVPVSRNSTRTFRNVAPEPFGGESVLVATELDNFWLDAFSEKSADLNGDCNMKKVYGYAGTGTKGSF